MLSKTRQKKRDRAKLRRLPKTGCLVYALLDPETGDIRYVGQTRTPLLARLANHKREAHRRESASQTLSPCLRWVKSILDRGAEPNIKMLDPKGVWDASEAAWIERLTAQGENLLNVQRRIAA